MGVRGDVISEHEVRVLQLFRDHPGRWYNNHEACEAAGVCHRTTRLHTAKFGRMGILEVERVYPGYRFRVGASNLTEEGKDYLERWERARKSLIRC